ncbi:MAG: DNA repair protein RecO [Eggerthellaceae bacterium]
MAKPAFSSRTLSLRKTKLGESDLIITALREDGSLLRAVAKGARKPTSQFASRLEVFSVCDCLVAQGRNLHVFSEARCISPHLALRSQVDRNAAASPVVEALAATTHEDLEIPRLFDMSCAALDRLEDVELGLAPSITAAFLLKLVAMLGYRPSLSECICCGQPVDAAVSDGTLSFSFSDGGVVCRHCANAFETTRVDSRVVSWSQALLGSTFKQVEALHMLPESSFAVLRFMQTWLRENLSTNLKSLSFLLSCGLF